MRSAETGGGSGGGEGAPNPPENPETQTGETTADEKEPEPEGATLEEKVSSAKGIIGNLFGRLKAALGANARIQQQFGALQEEAKNAKAESTRLAGELKSEKDAHKLTSDKLANSEKDVERLEGICGLRGLNKDQVIAAASTGNTKSGEELYNEWQDLKKSDPAKASAFRKKHQAALTSYAESLKKPTR